MTTMAAPVMRGREAVGVISIAGPRQRLPPASMQHAGTCHAGRDG
jgi:DNA-binding IclR family transcriptional regulator